MSKPIFRLDERKYPDDALIPLNTNFWRRIEFQEAVYARPSLYYRSAIDSIDAALPLLVIGHTSQAYLLLFQSLEVCLKGLLDELKSAGLATWMVQNPGLAKKLASNSSNDVITDIGQMHFLQAVKGTLPIVDFEPEHAARTSELNKIRNTIVHRGGEEERNPYYLSLIFTTILPMLDDFFARVLKPDLADLILHPIAREIVVVAKYRRIANDDSKTFGKCVSHLNKAYFSIWQTGGSGTPKFDPGGFSTYNQLADDVIKWQNHYRKKLKHDLVFDDGDSSTWELEVSEITKRRTYCRLCDEPCFVTSNWEEARDANGKLSFDVQEVSCSNCHLEITDPLLAEIHYGRVNEELIGENGWKDLLQALDFDESGTRKNES